MSLPAEHTSGIDEARKALAASKARRYRTASIVERAATTTSQLNAIAEHPEPLIDSLRQIIRGAA